MGLVCHPGYDDDDLARRPPRDCLDSREEERRLLTSAELRQFLEEQKIRVISYREFAETPTERPRQSALDCGFQVSKVVLRSLLHRQTLQYRSASDGGIIAPTDSRIRHAYQQKNSPTVDLPVRVWGMSARRTALFQHARAQNISFGGALISGVENELKGGDVIGVQCAEKKTRCTVIWR